MRLLLRSLLALPLVLLGLVGLLLAALQLQGGRDLLRDAVVAAASGPDFRLGIGRIDGAPPGRLVVENLRLGDAQGTWLTGDRIELDWSPLALLGGTLDVARLSAGRIALTRLPAGKAPAEPTPGGFTLPTLPLAIRLDRLEVGELALAAPVAGEPLDLSIEGALAAEQQGLIDSHLRIAERDGQGSVAAKAIYRLADRNLSVSLDASAPAGGRISRVSGLPGAPGLAFSLSGDGPLPGWQGQWRAEAGPVVTASGRLGLDSLQPLSLTLSGKAIPGSDFPAEAAAWVRPALSLDLAADYAADTQRATLTVRDLSSGSLAASGRAEAALAEDRADAQLQLTLGDPAPLRELLPGLSLQGGRIAITAKKRGQRATLTAEGSLERPVLAGDDGLGFETLELQLDSRELALDAPLSGGARARLELTGKGPLGDPAATGLLAPETRLTLVAAPSDQAMTLDSLELVSGPLRLTGQGRYRLAGDEAGSGKLTARLEEGDLSRLSGLAGLDLGGSLSIALDGSLRPDGSGQASLSAAPQDLQLGQPALQALLGARPLLTAQAERTADGRIRLTAAELSGTPVGAARDGKPAQGSQTPLRLHAEGSLSPADDQLDLTASLALPRLAVLQDAGLPLSGAATLDLTAFGPLAAPQAVWALRGEGLSYQDTRADILKIDGTTTGLPDGPRGHVDLAAATGAGPLKGAFDYALAGRTARLDKLSLTHGRDRLSGDLAADLPSGTADGSLKLSLADLSTLTPLVGADLAGSLDAAVTLKTEAGHQGARATARAQGLQAAGMTLGSLELTASGRDLTGTPALTAEVTASDLAAPDVALKRLTAKAEGSLEKLRLEASLAGKALQQDLEASGRAELSLDQATRVRLTALQASLGKEELSLKSPARLLLDRDRMQVAGLDLGVAEGRIRLDADLQPGKLDATLRAEDLPVRLAALAEPTLEPLGKVDLTARLSGPPPRPKGTLTLVASGLQLDAGNGSDVPPLDARIDGRLADGRLSADGRISGFAKAPLTLRAELPLLVTTAPLSVSLPPDRPLKLRANWDGQVEQLMAVVPVDTVRFGGQGKIDFGLDGTLAAPVASGSVSIEDGFYENYLLGMSLKPVTLEIDGQGERIEIKRFSGRDSEGGSLNAQGIVDLSGKAPRFDLTLKADKAHLVQRDDVNGSVDADLALKGTTEGASLAGNVRVLPTEIRLINALPPSVTELKVVNVNDKTPGPPEPQGDGKTPGIDGLQWLSLGVDVTIPGQVFVRGRGLDSEWRGTLQIAGTAEQPRIRGQLSPVRGSFDFAGRVFTLSPNSTIQFLGSATPDPQLNITATYQSESLTANINITGSVSDPQIGLTSSPDLPEDEILARVLFGKSSGKLSAGEAVQLAQAAATLEGSSGGIMDLARRTLGVDVLSFAPGDSGSDLGSLKVGKYISDDVFIGAQQGATPGSSTAIVEWDLTPNITVESEVGAANGSNASVNWKWDY
ncbi:translocation/assembly module TamB domain-containing protein [Tistlia consotensis]|uniref:translocation/assembly module TamB domain-containing protein n=1 Tax=Tistlia consotensis TaxID=1321365 RepID=UPI000A156337|nr:translocation/assembly module TamB domain-containing protein [Tistlia consotensis]